MSDSFIPGADDSKNTPEPEENWLIPVNYEDQKMAHVEVLDIVDDGAYVKFKEAAKVGKLADVEYEEGDKEKFEWGAFENGKPLGQ